MTGIFRHIFILSLLVLVQSLAEEWQVIQQPTYEVIFPSGLSDEAQQVAAKLDVYLAEHQRSLPLNKGMKPISLVLLTDHHVSNGNVMLMPYRSRWYNKPASFARLEWYDVLAVHEGRHVIQFNQIYENPVGNVLHTLMGDMGSGALLFLFVPDWYLEGDAVLSETALTPAGRGRVASFDLWFRTDLLSHPPYSYDRAMLGTGFDRVPYLNPYVLGYFLTGQAQMAYGEQVYDQTLAAIATSGNTFSFNQSFKNQTGQSLEAHYQSTLSVLEDHWRKQLSELTLTPVTTELTLKGDHWKSMYPVAVSEGQTAALVVDVKQGTYLVTVVSNHQVDRQRTLPSSVASSYTGGNKTRQITAHGAEFCWIEPYDHPVKRYVSYGELVCWSEKQEQRKLTRGEKLTSVRSLGDGFIAHRFTAQRQSQLVLLDNTGRELKQWSLPVGSLVTDISGDEEQVVYVLTGSKQDGIYQLNTRAGQPKLLLSADSETLRSPQLSKHWLVFTSDRSGIDQLYARSIETLRIYQIATRPFGAYYPVLDSKNQKLLFSDYTATGQLLVSIPFSDKAVPDAGWQPLEAVSRSQPFIEPLTVDPLPEIQTNPNYEVEPYSPTGHLWNPHSWLASGWYSSGNDFGLSGTVFSADVLDKLSSEVSFGYDTDSQFWLSALGTYRLDAGPLIQPGFGITTEDEFSGTLAVKQPIVWHRGVWDQALELTAGGEWETDESPLYFTSADFTTAHQAPAQAIAPPLGVHQLLYADENDSAEHRLYSVTDVTFSPTAGTALSAQLQLQQRQNPESLIEKTAVFSELEPTGFGYRYQLDARWNPGALGWAMGSVAFLRNTDYGIHWTAQQDDQDSAEAIGLSVAPSMNLFRNSMLEIRPEFGLYYRLDEEDYRFSVTLTLARQGG